MSTGAGAVAVVATVGVRLLLVPLAVAEMNVKTSAWLWQVMNLLVNNRVVLNVLGCDLSKQKVRTKKSAKGQPLEYRQQGEGTRKQASNHTKQKIEREINQSINQSIPFRLLSLSLSPNHPIN